MTNQLTVIEDKKVVLIGSKEIAVKEVFTDPKADALKEILKMAEMELVNFEYDLETDKGRKEVARFSRKFATSKRAVDDMGKELVAGIKAKAKSIDSNRKLFRDKMDELRDRAREPLTQWEQKEEKRKAVIVERINSIKNYNSMDTSQVLKIHLEYVKSIVIDQSFFEYYEEASFTKEEVIKDLERWIDIREQDEKQKAELEQLRAEKEKADRLAREDKIAEEAREKAIQEERDRAVRQAQQAEREAQEQQENLKREAREAKEKAERAEREAKEKAEKEKADFIAEMERQAQDEKDRIAKEKAKEKARQENIKYVTEKLSESKADIINLGVPSETADMVIRAIYKNEIRNAMIKL